MRDLVKYYVFLLTVFADVGIRISNGQQNSCTKNRLLGTGASWKCRERKKCALASTIPQRNIVICGSGKICCPEARPPPDGIKTGRPNAPKGNTSFKKVNEIAKRKCEQYRDYRYENYTIDNPLLYEPKIQKYKEHCVHVEPLIVNGEEALKNEFPHMALLGYDEEVSGEGNWLCGGSLISEQFILSAAHCTKTDGGQLVKWAALGIIHRSDILARGINKTIFRIKERYNHPSYKAGKSTYENDDIAVYELQFPIQLSPSIRPICIYYQSSAFGSEVYVSGWGKLFAGGTESESLQKAKIHNLDPKECSGEPYADDPFLKKGFDRQTMICGGHLSEAIDTCGGDSGGPMQIPMPTDKNCTWIQIGITSRGPAYCGGNIPAIYTRVAAYLPWIQKIVWPNEV